MNDNLALLKSLISTSGLSGHEAAVRQLVEAAWGPLADELSVSRLGSLHALKRGSGAAPRRSILLSAHMDAIGLMVTTVIDGFLRVTEIGGLDHRVLPGQLVTVHGREDLPGVIVQPPARLLPDEAQSGPVALKYLLVDTGLRPDKVDRLVRAGDLISFAQEPLELKGDLVAGHSLDNRASVVAVTQCLRELGERGHAWDVWAVASSQEEETLGGARTSAFQLRPDLAVAIDVTWAKGPGTPDHKAYPLGKGPTLVWGPNIHPGVHKAFKELAEQLEIPHNVEVTSQHSGTDAIALQVAAEGIPSMVVGLPLRYMHTPVEVIALKDISRAGRLLAEFIARLDDKFMDQLSWD